MTEIITYRLSATGIWQYEFCRDGETVGSVASVVSLREPARIEGRDISWYSRFDMDTDVVPGVSRKVKDNYTGEAVYRIVCGSRIFMKSGRGRNPFRWRSETETISSAFR